MFEDDGKGYQHEGGNVNNLINLFDLSMKTSVVTEMLQTSPFSLPSLKETLEFA